MKSKTPTVRQIAWLSLIPQLIVLSLIILAWYQFDKTNFIIYGAITYVLISQALRRVIAREHRKGIVKVHKQDFSGAIPHFERSYQFFKENKWVDQYRFLTLLSSGRMSYREMALNNIAFCHSQTGNGKLSKEYYQKTLDEFPNSSIAKVGLRFFESMENIEQS